MNCPSCQKPAKHIVNGFSRRLNYHLCHSCDLVVEDYVNPSSSLAGKKYSQLKYCPQDNEKVRQSIIEHLQNTPLAKMEGFSWELLNLTDEDFKTWICYRLDNKLSICGTAWRRIHDEKLEDLFLEIKNRFTGNIPSFNP